VRLRHALVVFEDVLRFKGVSQSPNLVPGQMMVSHNPNTRDDVFM
jgi:hypothetical protein